MAEYWIVGMRSATRCGIGFACIMNGWFVGLRIVHFFSRSLPFSFHVCTFLHHNTALEILSALVWHELAEYGCWAWTPIRGRDPSCSIVNKDCPRLPLGKGSHILLSASCCQLLVPFNVRCWLSFLGGFWWSWRSAHGDTSTWWSNVGVDLPQPKWGFKPVENCGFGNNDGCISS